MVEDELRLRRFIAGLKEDEAGPVRRRYAEWIEGRIGVTGYGAHAELHQTPLKCVCVLV